MSEPEVGSAPGVLHASAPAAAMSRATRGGRADADGVPAPEPDLLSSLIAANLPDPHILLAANGVIRFAAPSLNELLGIGEGDLAGRSFFELVHPDDSEKLGELLREIAPPGTRTVVDLRLRDGAHGWRRVELRSRGVAGADGATMRLAAVIDVGARRTADDSLRASEERYRRFFEDDLTGDFIATVDGRLLACNSAFATILGYSSIEEVLAVPSLDLYVDPSDRAVLVERIRREGVVKRVELALRRKDGRTVHVIENVVGVVDGAGELAQFHGYLFDITEQRRLADERTELLMRERAARALAEAAERRAAFLSEIGNLLDTSLDYRESLTTLARLVVPTLADYCLIDEVTADGGTRRVARAHVDPEAEALLRLDETNAADADPEHHPVVRVVRTAQPVRVARVETGALEQIAHGPEHLEKLLELGIRSYLIVPLLARGRTLGAMTMVCSVSGRQYSEQDVELAEAVARRAALAIDNARLYGRAQQEARTREEVLAFVSHDLRNPLATILLNASAMIETIPEERLWAEEREQLEWIARSSEQMNRMIQDLLDVARIDSGRLPMRPADVSVAPLLFETSLLLHPVAQEKGVRILCDDVPATLTARIDRERFLRVLANLVGNSIKFTAPGGWVRLGVEAVDSALQFTVADNGVGISPEDRNHIFEPYWQGRRTMTSKDRGSGLGLAIARGIIEAHGGSIGFDSTPGEGTTFYVRIPLASDGPAAP